MWTVLLVIATIGVAIFTAILALSTRTLARSSTTDQRSQWRPVIIPSKPIVDEASAGELAIELRNVGRGPALGLQGELRRGSEPYAASIPGQQNILAPDDQLGLRFRLPEPPAPGGAILRARLSYYDVAEQWHITEVLMSRRQPVDSRPLVVGRTNVEETGRYLTASQGSRRSRQQLCMSAWARVRGLWASGRSA